MGEIKAARRLELALPRRAPRRGLRQLLLRPLERRLGLGPRRSLLYISPTSPLHLPYISLYLRSSAACCSAEARLASRAATSADIGET